MMIGEAIEMEKKKQIGECIWEQTSQAQFTLHEVMKIFMAVDRNIGKF